MNIEYSVRIIVGAVIVAIAAATPIAIAHIV